MSKDIENRLDTVERRVDHMEVAYVDLQSELVQSNADHTVALGRVVTAVKDLGHSDDDHKKQIEAIYVTRDRDRERADAKQDARDKEKRDRFWSIFMWVLGIIAGFGTLIVGLVIAR